ncbi:hypothetical protein BD410DRAFT_258378 [Rickenella mellea]|uniref:F-box domain-containing protein n=1 Tax=Rickenella mellea TaxID=50990 RepID=A0A4Y7Q451_9AGAM|nr:hypothetical protein BD410DRAFT_258378 [Rickenella mellea]
MIQSCPILTLPQDVLIEIYLLLPLWSVASLRQCCLELQQSISNDKRLWMQIIQRDKANRRIPLLPYRRPINSANAFAVESWIRNAITIEKMYESNLQLTLDHTVVPDRLPATWAKLIRGRWCLVATSNVHQSWLSLWDGGSTGRPLRMRYSLPGPVMDGLMEDTNDGIHLALSIGIRSPHIQVLRLAQWQDRVHIDKLATIDGASHPKVLRGSILGFAVKNGDDSFPRLIDWISGKACVLGLVHSAHQIATKHSTCWAMELWGDHVVAVFDTTVNMYGRPNFQTGSSPGLLEVIRLRPNFAAYMEVYVREAHCVTCPELPVTSSGSPKTSSIPLGIICRNHLGETLATIILDLGTSQDPKFRATERVWWDLNPMAPDYASTMRVVVGLTNTKLFLSDIRLDGDPSFAPECSFGTSLQLPPSDLPLLHFHPYIDFDDARGILLIATSRGDFWTARVLEEDILTPDSLEDELPPVRPESHTRDQIQPTTMDLPMYYKYRRDVESYHIPDELRVETIRTWYTPGCDNLNLPGWSNDWETFPDFTRWIIPPLRWGYADDGFQEYYIRSIIALIRNDFNILGDPVPLLYNMKDTSVIFRVGERIYVVMEGEGDEEEWYLASQVLLTLEEFSSDPSRIYTSDKCHNSPCYRDGNADELNKVVVVYDVSVEHVALGDIDMEVDPDPTKWTDERWKDLVEEYISWNRSCKRSRARAEGIIVFELDPNPVN